MREYILMITSLFLSLSFAISQENAFEWADTTFEIGQKRSIRLKFDFDGPCTVRPCHRFSDNGPTIDTLVSFLRNHPTLEIEVGSHQDLRGSKNYNQKRSEIWAKGTKEELIIQGIRPSRITYKGYGESEPLISENEIRKMNSEEDKRKAHQLNQRIVVMITKK